MDWPIPDRVKHLSVSTLQYDRHDMGPLEFRVLETPEGTVGGVAAWAEADERGLSMGRKSLLLHGIYVLPGMQKRGFGSRLFEEARAAALRGGFDGLIVKAQAGAEGFFVSQGMVKLPVLDPERDYPRRYWLPLP